MFWMRNKKIKFSLRTLNYDSPELYYSGSTKATANHTNTCYMNVVPKFKLLYVGRLDLAVLFTPSTLNRQNRNQVHWNICAGVCRSTPYSEVVQTEQSRDLFQKRWRIIACMHGNILYRLIYSGLLQSAQFYLFMRLFWRTPSTLKIAKSSPPRVICMHHGTTCVQILTQTFDFKLINW